MSNQSAVYGVNKNVEKNIWSVDDRATQFILREIVLNH